MRFRQKLFWSCLVKVNLHCCQIIYRLDNVCLLGESVLCFTFLLFLEMQKESRAIYIYIFHGLMAILVGRLICSSQNLLDYKLGRHTMKSAINLAIQKHCYTATLLILCERKLKLISAIFPRCKNTQSSYSYCQIKLLFVHQVHVYH